MLAISLVFFCSGFAALVYELLWMRQLGLIFGNTVHAAAAVMTAYMLGLALGAKFAGQWARKLQKPIRAFGILEAGIGLCALIMPLLFHLLRLTYRYAFQNVSEDIGFLTCLRFVLAILALLIPTALMGATLPVLSKGLLLRKKTFGAVLGLLYGLNTLGAATGIVLCGFVLIPKFGVSTANGIAVGINLAVCLCALVLSRRLDRASTDVNEIEDSSIAQPLASHAGGRRWLLVGAFLSGAFALALEVIWFRTLVLVFGTTTYSFATMLAVFLLGIALGSSLLSWISDRVKQPLIVFLACQLGIAFYTMWTLRLFNVMPDVFLKHLMTHGYSWNAMLFSKFLISVVFLLPVTILFGVAFTSIARAIRNSVASASRTVGDVYTVNTIGAAIGSCVAGFVLLPNAGMLDSLRMICMAMFILVVAFSVPGLVRVWLRAGFAAVALAGLGMVCLHSPNWDPQLLSAGPYFQPTSYIRGDRPSLQSVLNSERLLYYREGTTSLISVTKSLEEQVNISSGGKVEADTSAKGMVIQRMMSHLPMLLHPNPRKVVNLGLGAGVTLGALSCYPLEHLEVVEIEPATIDAARVWGPWNHHVMDDPQLRITINDGRNHFFATTNRYDVITSDPIEPVVGAAASLYAIEHFQYVRDRLNVGGIMSQFLPLYELSREDVRMILRSFHHVFPESVLFFTGSDTIIIGFNDKVDLSMGNVRKKYLIPAVYDSLGEYGFTSPQSILGMFVADLRGNVALTGDGELNSDRFPRIEYSAPRSALHSTIDQNQEVLLDLYSELPADALDELSEGEAQEAKRNQRALKLALQANVHRGRGDYRLNIEGLIEAVKLSPGNAIIRNDLVNSLELSAKYHEAAQRVDQAVAQYDLVLKYEPLSFTSLSKSVHYLMQRGQSEKAKTYLDRGLEAYPDSPLFIFLRGKYKATTGDMKGGLEDMEAAIEILPRFVVFWEDYAKILSFAGRPDAAKDAQDRANWLLRDEA